MRKTTCTYLRYTMLLLASFMVTITSNAATITWDGGGDGVNWDDPNNWDINSEPTAADEVIILTNSTVVIRQSGEVATMVTIQTGATLTIQSGATFTSNDSPEEGIILQMNASLINRGILTILNVNLTSGNSGAGIKLDDTGAKADNYGTIIINGGGDDSEGIVLEGGTSLTNHSSGTITISNMSRGVLFVNGTVVNDGTMTLNMGDDNVSGIEINFNRSFTNNGTLTINANASANGEPLDISGTLSNNGLINVTGTSMDKAVILKAGEGSNGLLINEFCGIINIDDNLIEIQENTRITNKGIITTGFTGTNTNEGTFTNDGEIRTTNGTFSSTPNAVTGSGNVVVGNLPATQSLCVSPIRPMEPIPTLSQWGLLILGLLILNLGVFFIYRINIAK